MGADLVVMAGFMTILTEELFQAYPQRRHQYPPLPHPFLLRCAAMASTSTKGSGIRGKISGATVHFVTEECDAGPSSCKRQLRVLPGDTPEVLQRRIMEQCEWKLLPQAVSLFCQDRLKVEGRAVHILDCL